MLELGPLPAAAVAELAGHFGVADLAGPVLERARGHTLFTVESLRAAAEGGRDLAAVPASLRNALLTRARRAGPEAETLLRAAVVVGAAFDLEVVAGLLDLPVEVAAARAEQALAARLLVEDDTGAGYRFANDLVREVLYATSPRPTRVSRHRRLAGMLADRPEAAAGHAAAAGDWPAAATAWMAAAANAAGSYANRDAEGLLGQAVAAAERAGDPSLEASARLDRGRVLVALGDYPGAFADQERALELARRTASTGWRRPPLSSSAGPPTTTATSGPPPSCAPRPGSWPSGRWRRAGPGRRRCCWPLACATPTATWPGPGRPSTPS